MSDQYVGEIRMFSGNYAPQGWAMCNGQTLSISENEALYSLLGATYGGDGRTNFKLPDLRGRLPIHTGPGYALGAAAGVEQVTLTAAQLPAHTHVVNVSSLAGTLTSPEGVYWAGGSAGNQYSDQAPNGQMDPAAMSSVGGNQAHNNVMPYQVLTFIIALQGNYPTAS